MYQQKRIAAVAKKVTWMLSQGESCQMVRGCRLEVKEHLAVLIRRWQSLLAESPNDPKLIEVNEKYMLPTAIYGNQLMAELEKLEKALYGLSECKVRV